MILVTCPHCNQLIEILALNCKIFRCGVKKNNYEQIPPHLPKIDCDRLVEHSEIFGCGKPFRIEVKLNETQETIYETIICDYI